MHRYEDWNFVVCDFLPLLWCLRQRNYGKLIYLALADETYLYANPIIRRIFYFLGERCLGRERIPTLCTGEELSQSLKRRFNADVTTIDEGNWYRKYQFLRFPLHVAKLPRKTQFMILYVTGSNYAKGRDIGESIMMALTRELAGNVHFVIVGSPDKLNLPANQTLYYERVDRDQMPALYDSADVLLFTSRSENSPGPPFEAMARGCVVASTFNGDYLKHDVNCLRMPCNDPLEASRRIIHTLKNRLVRESLIEEGRRTVEDLKAKYKNAENFSQTFYRFVKNRFPEFLQTSLNKVAAH